jgi:hypothetical protein
MLEISIGASLTLQLLVFTFVAPDLDPIMIAFKVYFPFAQAFPSRSRACQSTCQQAQCKYSQAEIAPHSTSLFFGVIIVRKHFWHHFLSIKCSKSHTLVRQRDLSNEIHHYRLI